MVDVGSGDNEGVGEIEFVCRDDDDDDGEEADVVVFEVVVVVVEGLPSRVVSAGETVK